MRRDRSLQKQSGMMLLEGLIAVVIFSLGILAIVGLKAATIRHTTDAKYRLEASFLANQSIGTMWAKRTNLGSHAVNNEEVKMLPSGKRTIEVAGRQVTVTITWQLPGETKPHNYIATTRIDG